MVGHDAPNALERTYNTQRSQAELDMDRRLIGYLVGELNRLTRSLKGLQELVQEYLEQADDK